MNATVSNSEKIYLISLIRETESELFINYFATSSDDIEIKVF